MSMIKRIGLDWIPELWGRSVFEEWPPWDDTKASDVAKVLKPLLKRDAESIEYSETRSMQIFDYSNDRIEKIETKAYTLIGTTGITTAFTVGFGGLLLDQLAVEQLGLKLILGVPYFLVVFSFFFTIYLSLNVVTVGNKKYVFKRPSSEDILRLPSDDLAQSRVDYIASLYVSHLTNNKIADRKASYLIGGQLWFRNSIIFLLLTAIILSSLFIFTNARESTESLTPLPSATCNPTKDVIETLGSENSEALDPTVGATELPVSPTMVWEPTTTQMIEDNLNPDPPSP